MLSMVQLGLPFSHDFYDATHTWNYLGILLKPTLANTLANAQQLTLEVLYVYFLAVSGAV